MSIGPGAENHETARTVPDAAQGITLVGGIPRPIGGVTAYVQRLAEAYGSLVRCVVDLYPADEKARIPVPHIQLRAPTLPRLWWLLRKLRTPVYFNFSGARGLVVLALLRKPAAGRWALTLHNGDVAAYLDTPGRWQPLRRALARRGLAKCDLVGVISPRQRAFYVSMGYAPERLGAVSPYFPAATAMAPPGSHAALETIAAWRNEGHDVFVISGYPMAIYRHEQVLERFEALWAAGHRSMRLALFLYGDDAEGRLSRLAARFDAAPFAAQYWDTGSDVFLAALAQSSGYLRMNSVDSFGVAVAEAVSLGIPVLATNVCDRYPGATLVDVDDFDAMGAFVTHLPPAPEAAPYDNGVGAFLRRLAGLT